MGLFDFIYGSATTDPAPKPNDTPDNDKALSATRVDTEQPSPVPSSRFSSSADASEPCHASPLDAAAPNSSTISKDPDTDHPTDGAKRLQTRGFSLHSLAFLSNRDEVKPALSTVQEHKEEARALAAFFRRRAKVPKANKRTEQSALIVRSLIVGQLSIYPASSKASTGISKPQMSKVKAQLMQPKSANKVIAHLRALPASDVKVLAKGGKVDVENKPAGPVHAICLDTTDAEAEKRHFSRLTDDDDAVELAAESISSPSVASASIDKLANMFKDMHIVNLIMSPDFGLGQPGDGHGILSGAIPTASTVINGVEQITPQLMALGLATGKAVLPDHKGVYPPTDRISVLTYWWGLEVVLPASSLHYLSTTQSVAHTMINILTAMSAMYGGVREILPFVRYIGQFIDFEFNAIQSQNQGQGVVCAATWIMPAAMVPRPWDFASPPFEPAAGSGDTAAEPTAPSAEIPRASQATETPSRPSGALPSDSRPSDVTAGSGPALSHVPSLPPVLPEVVLTIPNGTANPISV